MTREEIYLLEESRQDYERWRIEYGFTKEFVDAMLAYQGDRIPMPSGFDRVQLQDSIIEGQGMFLLQDANVGDFLGPGRIESKRTPLGRYTNHSPRPNAYFELQSNGDLHVIAKTRMLADDEITIDYRQAGAVNGVGLSCIRVEMLKTLQIRCVNLNLPVKPDEELGRFLDMALQTFGYLPSIPDMLTILR